MYNHLDNNYNIIPVPFAPFLDGVNRDFKVSEHLTFGEIYDASFHTDKSVFLEHGIAVHKNAFKVHELIRSYTKKALYLGSLYRSYEWELHKERSGNSQHLYGAMDVNGVGVNKLIKTALEEKNELYHQLRDLGVNAFGEYSWGWHLDFRQAKANNEITYWSKKKSDNPILIPIILFLIILFRKVIMKIFK
jgi:hypothetical protein